MTATGSVRPPTAQEAVLAALRRDIAAGTLEPGAQVVQDALAERYGVSRVPVREALKILEGEGQVVYAPHRGYFVADLSLDDLVEVYRLRDLLETEAVSVAVPRLTDTDVDRLAVLAEACRQADAAGDVTAMTAANREFHFALFEASGMPRLVRLLRLLWDATDAYRARYYGEPGNRSRVGAEHAALVDALTARDVGSAVAVSREHRAHAVERLAEVLGPQR